MQSWMRIRVGDDFRSFLIERWTIMVRTTAISETMHPIRVMMLSAVSCADEMDLGVRWSVSERVGRNILSPFHHEKAIISKKIASKKPVQFERKKNKQNIRTRHSPSPPGLRSWLDAQTSTPHERLSCFPALRRPALPSGQWEHPSTHKCGSPQRHRQSRSQRSPKSPRVMHSPT